MRGLSKEDSGILNFTLKRVRSVRLAVPSPTAIRAEKTGDSVLPDSGAF